MVNDDSYFCLNSFSVLFSPPAKLSLSSPTLSSFQLLSLRRCGFHLPPLRTPFHLASHLLSAPLAFITPLGEKLQ